VARNDKLTKLVAVFDQFYRDIAQLDDPVAQRLVENWATIRNRYLEPASLCRSALAAGMEQGLRDTPEFFLSMSSAARKRASLALSAATASHYPDSLRKDAERLVKIKDRGSIRGENEFYLVRHRVDVLEGEPSLTDELHLLNRLIDKFESRGR